MTGDRPAPAPPDDAPDLLGQVLAGRLTGYALLHRPEETSPDTLEVLSGDFGRYDTLADLPLPERPEGAGGHELLALVPYRQIRERGFAARDDGTPLLAMTVTAQDTLPLGAALRRLPDEPVELARGGFDVTDEEYADLVRRVTAEEIGAGEGANFVVKRTYTARLPRFSPATALSLFRRLLERESGAHWTFLVHTGDRVLVGATPERHVGLRDGTAVMNPISGTYCHPPGGATLDGVLSFLTDRKETDELYMVVDEELKMMARLCPSGGQLTGPRLKEMARVTHTEYLITGRTGRDVRDILRETLFAPTVTGSPLENAARVIRRHEPSGRGYYSGVAALVGRDASGARTLDSAILIRTADISADGRVRIGAGATLVRHSNPVAEARETRAKVAGLLSAPERPGPGAGPRAGRFAGHPAVRAALAARNDDVAAFWLDEPDSRIYETAKLAGRRALLVDAEDTFTAMLAHQIRALGVEVTVRRFDEAYDTGAHDVVVLGPGPGDPRHTGHPRVAHLRAVVSRLLAGGRPLLSVCLSHQVLSGLLGLALVRRDVPHQGVRREIGLFGRREQVGFYNTFTARADADVLHHPAYGPVAVSRDAATGEVHALLGPRFASVQFHTESVLTRDGPRIIGDLLTRVTGP